MGHPMQCFEYRSAINGDRVRHYRDARARLWWSCRILHCTIGSASNHGRVTWIRSGVFVAAHRGSTVTRWRALRRTAHRSPIMFIQRGGSATDGAPARMRSSDRRGLHHTRRQGARGRHLRSPVLPAGDHSIDRQAEEQQAVEHRRAIHDILAGIRDCEVDEPEEHRAVARATSRRRTSWTSGTAMTAR